MGTGAVGLVADVGRASVRFGLSGGPEGVGPRDVRELGAAEHATFTGALTAYLDGVGARDRVLPSALAIAGAVRGDVINVTGSRWYVTLSGIRAVLRAPARALNDFAAAASALPMVKATALRAIGSPAPAVPSRAAPIWRSGRARGWAWRACSRPASRSARSRARRGISASSPRRRRRPTSPRR